MKEHNGENFLGTGLTKQQANRLAAAMLWGPELPKGPDFDSAIERLGLEPVSLVLSVQMKLHRLILDAGRRDQNPWSREMIREAAYMVDDAIVRTLCDGAEYEEEWKKDYQRYLRELNESNKPER